jgi:hypothetical protein
VRLIIQHHIERRTIALLAAVGQAVQIKLDGKRSQISKIMKEEYAEDQPLITLPWDKYDHRI